MEQQICNYKFISPKNTQEDLNRLENGAGGDADKKGTVKTAPYFVNSTYSHVYRYSGGT
jgi:hypothetical protein